MIRKLVLLFVTLLLLPALTACGAPPVAFSALPTFPDATELQAGQNTIADQMADAMKSSVGDKLKADIKMFEVPSDTTWESIQSFYNDSLKDSDWKATDQLNTSTDSFSAMGWQRGGVVSEQVLMVGFMPEMLGNNPVMIVSLFSE